MTLSRKSMFLLCAVLGCLMIACGPRVEMADVSAQELLPVESLIAQLQSPDIQVRIDAVHDLGARGPEAASSVPTLSRLLTTDPLIETHVLEALASIGKPALPILLNVLAKRPTEVLPTSIAEKGVIVMGRDVVPDLLSAIASAAKRPDPQANDDRLDLRAGLIGVFQTFGLPALPPLMRALNSPDPWVRGEAAYWIARLGSSALPAVPALKLALSRTAEPNRTLIAEALEKVR